MQADGAPPTPDPNTSVAAPGARSAAGVKRAVDARAYVTSATRHEPRPASAMLALPCDESTLLGSGTFSHVYANRVRSEWVAVKVRALCVRLP